MKNSFFLFLLAFLSASTLFAQFPTISGSSNILLGNPATYTLTQPNIPAGYNGVKSVQWRKNFAPTSTQSCLSTPYSTTYTVMVNECSFLVDAIVTYWKGGTCASPTQTTTSFTNTITVYTNCLGQPSITANGTPINGSTYNVPEGCTAPITFSASASNAAGFSWTGPSTWTPTGAFGATYTATPSSTGAGNVVLTAQGPCCGITITRNITINRTRPATSFVSPTLAFCTPANAQTFSIANTLGSLCGAVSFTYTLSNNTSSAAFTANDSRTLTTSASSVQVNFPAGNYAENLNVVVNYPGGASAAATIQIQLYNGVPATPTSVLANRIGTSCYYDARTPKSATATKYFWKINSGAWYEGNILSGYAYAGELFLGPSTEVVRVYAQNPCGNSGTYTKNLNIPSPSPNCMLMPGSDTGTDQELVEAEMRENELSEGLNDFEFRFFPVPATDYLYIESKASVDHVLQIVNMEGKIVLDQQRIQPGINELQIDLPTGMYFLRLTGTATPYQTKLYVKHQ